MSNDLPNLDGRVAIVTGSARRIGRAVASKIAAAGGSVVINARSARAEAEAVASEINTLHGARRAVACVADVTKPDDVKRLMGAAIDNYGKLDILINNAAAARGGVPLDDLTLEQWHLTLRTILDGTLLCAQAAAPYLAKSGHGKIINIGGISAHVGTRNHAHIITAKNGLFGLTKALALDLGPQGITVNTLSPGLIEAPDDDPKRAAARRTSFPPERIPLGRVGTVDEVASAIVALCGSAWNYMTGQVVHVNGGIYLAGM